MLADLRNSFLGELPSRLEKIEGIILELKTTSEFTEKYEALYRHIHSLKGTAGTHGLNIITTVCHALEDEIVKVEGNQSLVSDEQVNTWLSFIDLLRATIEQINSGTDDFSNIEAALADMRGRGSDFQYSGLLVISGDLQRQMCQSAFENCSVTLAFCNNGYEALGRLLKEPFDFLVSNMEIPELSGFALISTLRMSNSRNQHIPSILLTSKQIVSYHHSIDPDYVVSKDADMMENLRLAVTNIMNSLQQ